MHVIVEALGLERIGLTLLEPEQIPPARLLHHARLHGIDGRTRQIEVGFVQFDPSATIPSIGCVVTLARSREEGILQLALPPASLASTLPAREEVAPVASY